MTNTGVAPTRKIASREGTSDSCGLSRLTRVGISPPSMKPRFQLTAVPLARSSVGYCSLRKIISGAHAALDSITMTTHSSATAAPRSLSAAAMPRRATATRKVPQAEPEHGPAAAEPFAQVARADRGPDHQRHC
ncbi:hypothetical protein [Amycolatopsis sp. NBRC 101858]|uniref:hypothetical protein n=1 Tax=Amycolatopsis sp. NBRC 101858 TaxID=3032200 RepID=UPI0033392A2A